ncbi:MAG: YegS/Rv2252/BmrU family lipid kinase [Syntrophomonas sp.]
MKKVVLYYNPVAGGGRFKNRLDEVFKNLQDADLQVMPRRISSNADIEQHLLSLNPDEIHTLVAAGGDGTIHGLANALMKSGFKIPMGVFPVGTSNDVATHLNIPFQCRQYCGLLSEGQLTDIDLGRVNEHYFINVAAAGLLTDTAHEVQYRLKNVLGRGAYLLKSLEKIPRVQTMHLKMEVDGQKTAMDTMLFLVLNGGTAGGFQGLMPASDMNDGLLDFLAIKPVSLHQATQLLYNFLRGHLLQDDNIFYCQGREFRIELEPDTSTDLDGEMGPGLPWEVRVCPSAIKMWLP